MKVLYWVTFVLTVVGGVNWGLVGFFDFNLVTTLLGDGTTATKVVYDLVGLSSVYMLFSCTMGSDKCCS